LFSIAAIVAMASEAPAEPPPIRFASPASIS